MSRQCRKVVGRRFKARSVLGSLSAALFSASSFVVFAAATRFVDVPTFALGTTVYLGSSLSMNLLRAAFLDEGLRHAENRYSITKVTNRLAVSCGVASICVFLMLAGFNLGPALFVAGSVATVGVDCARTSCVLRDRFRFLALRDVLLFSFSVSGVLLRIFSNNWPGYLVAAGWVGASTIMCFLPIGSGQGTALQDLAGPTGRNPLASAAWRNLPFAAQISALALVGWSGRQELVAAANVAGMIALPSLTLYSGLRSSIGVQTKDKSTLSRRLLVAGAAAALLTPMSAFGIAEVSGEMGRPVIVGYAGVILVAQIARVVGTASMDVVRLVAADSVLPPVAIRSALVSFIGTTLSGAMLSTSGILLVPAFVAIISITSVFRVSRVETPNGV